MSLQATRRQYYLDHRDTLLQKASRRYETKHDEVRAQQNGPGSSARRLWLRKRHGIKNATGERRVGTCLICLKENVELVCDHNHQTGEIRGWPCRSCNLVLGKFKDDPVIVDRALRYLRGDLQCEL